MLAIAANTFDRPSETFIRAHVRHTAPGKTVLLCQRGGGAVELGCPTLSNLRGISTARHAMERFSNGLRSRWWRFVDPALRGPDEARVRQFLLQHEVQAVLAEYGPNGCLLREACKRAEIPLFVHFHGFDATRLARDKNWRRHYRRLFRDSSGVMAPSEFLAGRLRKLGCPNEKLCISPNGVDTALFLPTSRTPGRIIMVSRLVPNKGPLESIKAFAMVRERRPNAVLDVVGDGELMEDCISLAQRLGVADEITFHGAQAADRVANLMGRASIFMQHSVASRDGSVEAFGITPLEAAACELPVVVTKSGGLPETVVDGETGVLVKEHDVEGMARVIRGLLDDPAMSESMGRAGRARVEARFTHQRVAARLRQIMGLSCVGA